MYLFNIKGESLYTEKTNNNCKTTVTICLVWLMNNNETCCEQQEKSNCKSYDRKQLNAQKYRENNNLHCKVEKVYIIPKKLI